LRIADDWEERHIVLEELKALLGLNKIEDVSGLLNKLSADWQRLTADEENWDRRFPNPAFLGAWREHREIYGYVLRSELVYQLKRAREQHGDFTFEGPPRHLLVDEYQDLNRCDLAVVQGFRELGAEVYVAGDDDQSIYGFREAHPEGIRRFPQDFPGAREFSLGICKRCDPEILDLGLFIARLDHWRLDKPLRAEDGRVGGEIALLRYQDQDEEARGVARICHHLIQVQRLPPEQILILLRSDRHGAFSTPLRQALDAQGVPVGIRTGESDPLNEQPGRQVLACLRLLSNENDHLAWKTLLMLRKNRIGPVGLRSAYALAKARGVRFSEALQLICDEPTLVARHGSRIKSDVEDVRNVLQELRASVAPERIAGPADVSDAIGEVIERVAQNEVQRQAIRDKFEVTIESAEPNTIDDLVRALEVSREDIEQEIEAGKVNILTMHKAKGLTAEAVIVVAAEDEYLPGRAEGDKIGDERRWLYVSLTRAKHLLFITYCNARTGRQQHSGRNSGQTRRFLTRFLRDAPIAPQPGEAYVRNLAAGRR
jgi:DNA helicase-2/ATP-dependent DNA helicase PcrA